MLASTDRKVTAAAIYCRISKDDKGDQLGVRRQERDARKLAEAKGWPVAAVFIDDDVSAYVPGKRPEYARLLAAVKAGEVDALVVYDVDRLHRHPWELEEFFNTCDKAQFTELASVSGDFNLATDDGRLMARIMGAVAKKSSDDTARRIRRKHEELAEAGRPAGGGARPFGFERDQVTVVPHEAEMIRDCVNRLLAGESLTSICTRWNETGKLTAQGKLWRVGTARNMLMNGRLAGLREHRGEIVGQAVWPAIVDRATWERLTALLKDPGRRQERNGRASLLNGLVVCGRCGAKLATAPVNGRTAYRCQFSPGRAGCRGIAIVAAPVDERVVEAFFEALKDVDIASHHEPADDGAAISVIGAAETQLAELAELWGSGELTRPEWLAARRPIEARLKEARRSLSAPRSGELLRGHDAASLRDEWETLPKERQRALLAELIDHVTIGPARRGLNRFDPSRVDITWRV